MLIIYLAVNDDGEYVCMYVYMFECKAMYMNTSKKVQVV